MYRLGVVLAVLLVSPASWACSIAEPYPIKLPRSAPRESRVYEAPDVRVRYVRLGVKGEDSAKCQGFGTVAFSIPKEQLPDGLGLYFEQVGPDRYILFGPNGAFWTDYEIDGSYIFLFPWFHSMARTERVSVTLRIRIISEAGVAGRDAYVRYQLPAASEI